MNSKKEKKLVRENKRKRSQKKDKIILICGILVISMALLQVFMIGTYYLGGKKGHNQIILGDNVVTSEVCSQWVNYTELYKTNIKEFIYDDGFYEHKIPKEIVVEVCNKWEKVREEIDNK